MVSQARDADDGPFLREVYRSLYIDIHCHILPKIDDGPATMEDSLIMLRHAAESGIRAVAVTPHILENPDLQWENELITIFHSLCRSVIDEQLDIDLYLGSELMFQPGIGDLLERSFGTYRGMGRYFLIETPVNLYPVHFEEEVLPLISGNRRPIFSHPERIQPLIGDSEKIASLSRKGFLMAVSAGSLLGEFGRDIQSFAWEILDLGHAHFIVSDAHNITYRAFNLDAAWKAVVERYDEDIAEALLVKNPLNVLFGEPVNGVR